MRPDSLYRPHEAEIRNVEAGVLNFEVRYTASVAKGIVRAVEDRSPQALRRALVAVARGAAYAGVDLTKEKLTPSR